MHTPLECHDVRREHHPRVLRLREVATVGETEPRRRTELIHDRPELRIGHRHPRPAREWWTTIELVVTDGELAEPPRLAIVRGEIALRDGPATVRNPVAHLEVIIIQGPAPPTPSLRAAAECSDATAIEREVLAPDVAPPIEGLRCMMR